MFKLRDKEILKDELSINFEKYVTKKYTTNTPMFNVRGYYLKNRVIITIRASISDLTINNLVIGEHLDLKPYIHEFLMWDGQQEKEYDIFADEIEIIYWEEDNDIVKIIKVDSNTIRLQIILPNYQLEYEGFIQL